MTHEQRNIPFWVALALIAIVIAFTVTKFYFNNSVVEIAPTVIDYETLKEYNTKDTCNYE